MGPLPFLAQSCGAGPGGSPGLTGAGGFFWGPPRRLRLKALLEACIPIGSFALPVAPGESHCWPLLAVLTHQPWLCSQYAACWSWPWSSLLLASPIIHLRFTISWIPVCAWHLVACRDWLASSQCRMASSVSYVMGPVFLSVKWGCVFLASLRRKARPASS